MRSKSSELKKNIYDFVNQYRREYGRSPSLKIIGDEFGYNKTTIYRYLIEMNDSGEITYNGNEIYTREMSEVNTRLSAAKLVGYIPCGEGAEEEEYVEEYINLPESLFGKGEFYVLHASGDSMEDAGIFDRNLVVILKTPVAEIGDIVVAYIDNQKNTLKRFGGFDKNGFAILEYMNEERYPGKVIKVRELTIQGVAKYVIKELSENKLHGVKL